MPVVPNESVRLEVGGHPPWVIGLDDMWNRLSDLKLAWRRIPPGDVRILLVHKPDTTSTLAGSKMKVEMWPSCQEAKKSPRAIIRRKVKHDPCAAVALPGAVPRASDRTTVTRRRRSKGLFALLGAVLIWGSTFVATKDALQAFPPLSLAALRFALALAVLWPFYARRRRGSSPLPLGTAILMGFFGVFLYFALQNWALLYCRASTASLILASIPAFTALGSRLFLGEHMGPLRVTGILASIAGVAVLVRCENSTPAAGLSGESSGLAEAAFNPGSLLLIGAALAWSVYTVLSRRLSPSHPPILTTFQTTLWGLVFLLPFSLLEQQPAYLSVGRESWLVLLYLGVIASALPIFLWNYALTTFPASEAGIYVNLVPVVATTMGSLLLGERLSLTEVLAGLLVIAGVVLAQAPERPAAGATRKGNTQAARHPGSGDV